MQRFGYWVDLADVQLSEDGPTWIQGMPLGDYKHPFFGDIKITTERVQRFADNVNNNVRGTQLDIDYDHKMTSGEAAGWVQAADARPDGLYLLVDWTKKARDLIRDRAYRYFSPEFTDEWQHPKTQQKFVDVLFGGGITNRPFLKDIAPVNASELVLGDQVTNTGGKGMDPKELRKLLGLSEDATDDQVKAKLSELTAPKEPPKNDPPKAPEKLSEPNEDLKKLAETNPVIAKLLSDQQTMQRQLAEQSQALRLSEMTSRVKTLGEMATSKGLAYPAVVLNELPKLLTDMSDAVGKSVVELFEKLADTGMVKLGEVGKGHKDGGNQPEGQDAVHKAVTKLMEQDKQLSYLDAMNRVLSEQPDLFNEYRSNAYAGREN